MGANFNTKQSKPTPSAMKLQRAAFVGVISFVFFMTMMFAYYIRGSGLYFLLATAFLIVHLLTMISFFRLRQR